MVGGLTGLPMGARAGLSGGQPQTANVSGRPRHGTIIRLSAQWELAKFKRNADKNFASGSAEEYFEPVWDNLPQHMRDFLETRYRNFAGSAGETIISDTLDKAGFEVGQKKNYKLPAGIGRKIRNFDESTSQDLKAVLFDLFAKPGKLTDKPTGFEGKVASSEYNLQQRSADDYLKDPTRGNAVSGVEILHLPADRIKPDDLATVIEDWLARRNRQSRPGRVPKQDVTDLIEALRNQRGPDGRPLTIGQVSLVVLGASLPLLYPTETDDTESVRQP